MTQNKTLAQYQPHALGLLRIVTGYLFIMHGTTKLFQFPYIEMFANVPVASMFGAAGIIELIGGLLIILVVMLHNICGLLLGFSIGKLLKLEYKKCVAISIEVGMQNSGLASSLATLHFAAYPMATIPGAIFSVWHNISGALMARLYSSRGGK